METKQKSCLAILLAALLASSALASCGDSGTPAVTTSAPDNTKTDTTTEAETGPAYKKPDKDFSGQNLNILIWTDSRFPVEEETGDVINDAVFERNLTVQDTLGVTFTYDIRPGLVSDYPEWLNVLNASILAGDDSYQLAGGYGYRLAKDSLGGNFHNLKTNPYIGFTNPWWPSNIIEAADLGGQMTLCFENIDPTYYDVTYAMYFNKKLADDYGFENFYDMVKRGTWTIDRMTEFAKQAAKDLDGDGVMGEKDQWGNIGEPLNTYAFMVGCGVAAVKKVDDIPEFDMKNEHFYDAFTKAVNLNRDDKVTMFSDNFKAADVWADIIDPAFTEGRVLFNTAGLVRVTVFRAMETNFGILPLPKYDESQKEYNSMVSIGCANSIAIPATADAERCGAVIEALSAEGYYTLTPAYYDIVLKTKNARDDASSEMLDIIFDNRIFDIAYMFDWGGIIGSINGLKTDGKISSTIDSKLKAAEKELEKTLTAYAELE